MTEILIESISVVAYIDLGHTHTKPLYQKKNVFFLGRIKTESFNKMLDRIQIKGQNKF